MIIASRRVTLRLYRYKPNHISDTDLDGDAPLLGGAAEGLEGGAVEGAGRGQADGGEEERCSEHGDTRPELWQLAARSRVPSGFSDSDMLARFGHVRNG